MPTWVRIIIYALSFILITANLYFQQYQLAVLVMAMLLLLELVPILTGAQAEPLDYAKMAAAFKSTPKPVEQVKKENKSEISKPEPVTEMKQEQSKAFELAKTLANNDKAKAFAAAAAGYAVSKIQEELADEVESEDNESAESEEENE